MAKRKQPEANSVDIGTKAAEGEITVPVREVLVSDVVATGNNPAVGWSAEGAAENIEADSPPPTAIGEPPVVEEQGPETFCSLLAKAGYLGW